jgi:hypothetical protein
MSNSEGQNKREPFRGCIIEMDTIALNGIQRLYAIIRNELGKQDITIDEGLFARHFLGAYLETGLNRALQAAGRRATPETTQAIRTAYLAQLAETPVADSHPIIALVKGLSEKQVRVALLTRLGNETATAIFAPLLAFDNVTLICESQAALVGGFPWDVWRRASQTLQMADRLCAAVVASSTSNKAALAASLPVVAVPNSMTDFQDFTGAYACVDKFDGSVLTAVLQALRV